jgi:hypothetical protein
MVQKSRTNLGARNEQFLDETSKLERKVQLFNCEKFEVLLVI